MSVLTKAAALTILEKSVPSAQNSPYSRIAIPFPVALSKLKWNWTILGASNKEPSSASSPVAIRVSPIDTVTLSVKTVSSAAHGSARIIFSIVVT